MYFLNQKIFASIIENITYRKVKVTTTLVTFERVDNLEHNDQERGSNMPSRLLGL